MNSRRTSRDRAWTWFFSEGSEESLANLIESYRTMVNFMAHIDWGWRNDLEDVIDVGMIAVWEATQKIDIDRVRSTDAYVAMVVRGRMRNYCAKMMHRDTILHTSPKSGEYEVLENNESIIRKLDDQAETSDVLDILDVENALEHLSSKERLVIKLRFWEGWQLKEIAERLKCTKENVWYIEKQALGKLQPHLLY